MGTTIDADRRHVLGWLGTAVGVSLAGCTFQFGDSEAKECGFPVVHPEQPGRYANGPAGYDIRYPDDWDPSSSGDPSHFVALGPHTPSQTSQPYKRRLTVLTHYYDRPVSVETLAERFLRNAHRTFGSTTVGFQVLNQNDVTIPSGESGRLFDTLQGNPRSEVETPIRRRTLLVPLEGSRFVYGVSVQTHEEDHRAFLPTSQRILDSFTLTKRPDYQEPSVDGLISISTEVSEHRFSVERPEVWCSAYHPDLRTLFVNDPLQISSVWATHVPGPVDSDIPTPSGRENGDFRDPREPITVLDRYETTTATGQQGTIVDVRFMYDSERYVPIATWREQELTVSGEGFSLIVSVRTPDSVFKNEFKDVAETILGSVRIERSNGQW